MDLASMLNNDNDGNSPIDRRPSSRQMSISHRADSISSTTPTASTQSPQRNGQFTSTPTPTSLDRPRSSDERIAKPLPDRPPSTPAPANKRKRENGNERPAKRRVQEPPTWAQVIPERVHLGKTWDMVKPYDSKRHRLAEQETPDQKIPAKSQPHPPSSIPTNPSQPFGPLFSNQLPADDLTRTVADFLYSRITPLMQFLTPSNIEIEAKLGRIIDRDREDDRVTFGAMSEVVVPPNFCGRRTAFQASMTEEEHMAFNTLLNKTAIHTAGSAHGGGKTHERILDIDSFWNLPRAEAIAGIPPQLHSHILGSTHGPVRLRISNAWDTKTGAGPEKACIIKRRIDNLDISNPRFPFDYRISINIEYQYTGTRNGLEPSTEPNGARTRSRAKNRLKYFYPVCDIDFTKVISVPAGVMPGKEPQAEEFEHELEVELSSDALYEQLGAVARGDGGNRYEDLVRMLVDNVRLLTRSCGR